MTVDVSAAWAFDAACADRIEAVRADAARSAETPDAAD
jgi:hypothetical protein